ncbi:MAG: type IV secretion system protein DotC [Alphaproteobacteria bacterium]|nr:MAG: type IV secretion system protein DotC [Alphaproteobacteria bacterium]
MADTKIRDEALRDASLSYGARAGLAKRTWDIRTTLKTREAYMDKIYDFKRLLIPASSGLLIEPPIISEGSNATLIEQGGQLAAVADRIFNISRNARIVSSPRNWRAYLEREWGEVKLPPAVLLPKNDHERAVWAKNMAVGWAEGTDQADEIFQADLNKLAADYTGMIRYRKLLAQGIVSAPYALQIDRGVTGGGSEMRVGDRALQITGPSQLRTEAFEWQAVPR